MIPKNRLNYNRQPRAKANQDRKPARPVGKAKRDAEMRKRAQKTDRYFMQLAEDRKNEPES